MNFFFKFLKGSDKWTANDMNAATFNDFYLRLIELAINMYEWKNLPKGIDERYLEMTLLLSGAILFIKDENLKDEFCDGYAVMKTAAGGDLDIYATPNNRQAYAVTGYNKKFGPKDSVLIFNNRLRSPGILTLELYAHRLADLQRSIDVNVRAQKTPVLIHTTDKNKLSMKNIYSQYNGNEPVIFATKAFDKDSVNVLKTEAPYVADRLHVLKRQMWNEAITFIGIESANTEKAERLITDEVTSNLGTAEAQRYTKLVARRVAAEQINRLFDLDISVDFRSNNTILDTSPEGKEMVVDNATYRSYQSSDGNVKAVGEQGRGNE